MSLHAGQKLRWAATRVIFFHGIVFFLVLSCVNPIRLRSKTVNYFKPPSIKYLYLLEKGEAGVDQQVLKSYEKYFRVLNRYAFPMPFTYGTLGFISYHQGHIKKAVQYYEKALKVYPLYLNYRYNLALLALSQQDIPRAASFLTRALQEASAQGDYFLVEKSEFEVGAIVGKFTKQEYLEKWQQDYRDARFLLLAVMVYIGQKNLAVNIMDQLAQNDQIQEKRLVCVRQYIELLNNPDSHDTQEAFKACRDQEGWKRTGEEDNLHKDPFNIGQLSLKIW